MGLGHVPQEPLRPDRARPDVQGRQRRGAAAGGAVGGANGARGRFGEDLAAAWYRRNGYEVVARNWRNREGEIDIVARRSGVVVICEVKTRSSSAFGGPATAVGPAKQARLRRLATAFLASSGVHEPVVRFDVACVVGNRLDVIESAF